MLAAGFFFAYPASNHCNRAAPTFLASLHLPALQLDVDALTAQRLHQAAYTREHDVHGLGETYLLIARALAANADDGTAISSQRR